MSIRDDEPTFFDPTDFTVPTPPETLNPFLEKLAINPNTFLNTNRWVALGVQHHITTTLVPTFNDSSGSFSSPGYAEGSTFEDDFTQWTIGNNNTSTLYGFLAGFPRVVMRDDEPVDCVHIWGNNSDVFPTSTAVPLDTLSNIFIYSKTLTRLHVELDELANGSVPRFEIPVLRDRRSGDFIFRPAEYADIEEIIEETAETPTVVMNIFDNTSTIARYRTIDADALKTELE